MNDISGTTAGHNSKVRADIIRSVCREVEDLEAKRDEINTEIRDIMHKRIKGDLGMKIGDFNAMRRVYSMEDERRDNYLDTLREGFEALGAGEQLDFLKVQERIDSRPADPPAAETEKAKEKTAAAKKPKPVTRGALKKPKKKSGKKK